MNNLRNDTLWGEQYDLWLGRMIHITEGRNLDIYLDAIPFIRDWRQQFVEVNRLPCKGKRYNIALKHEMERPTGLFRKLTVKEFSELVWLSNDGENSRLEILAELRAARKDTDGLRDINTPKAAAKIVREELARREAEANGSAEAEAIEADQEADAADALADKMAADDEAGGGALVALMRRYTKNPDRIMKAFAEAFEDQPSFVHGALVRALDEMRERCNDSIRNDNFDRIERGEKEVKLWPEQGGFLKLQRTHSLLKRPNRG